VDIKAGDTALHQRLTAADQQIDELTQERKRLIAYGRSCGLHEASTLCSRMTYDAYCPAGSRFKVFTPKAQKALGDLLIKAVNKIASPPGGPYERFKACKAKNAESAKSRQEYIRTPPVKPVTPPPSKSAAIPARTKSCLKKLS